MIFSCREIQGLYPQLTAQDAVEWCRSGRLRPFTKRQGPCGLDPKSPKGWRRVFPTREAEEKYEALCERYSSLMGWLKARRVPDEEAMKADENRLAKSLQESGRPVFLPGIDQFQYNLFRRRQRETAEISRLLAEIEEFEGELNPGKVWGDPRLTPEKVFELLADCFFRSEDIEKILKQSASEEA
ncbi:MAG: hypothetical protein ACP5SH_08605 [Syntrophobacteraceae bacterium]